MPYALPVVGFCPLSVRLKGASISLLRRIDPMVKLILAAILLATLLYGSISWLLRSGELQLLVSAARSRLQRRA